MHSKTVARIFGAVVLLGIFYFASISLIQAINGAIPTPPADRLPEDPALRGAIAVRRVMAEKERAIGGTIEQFRQNLTKLRHGGTAAKDDLRGFAAQMQQLSEAALADYHAVTDRSVAYRRDLKHAEGAYREAARSMARRGEDYTDADLQRTVAVYVADFQLVADRTQDRAKALDRFLAELAELKQYLVQTQYAITDLRTFVEAYPESRAAEAHVIFDNHVRLYAGRFDKLIQLIESYRSAILDQPVPLTAQQPAPGDDK